jgi:hypothetical protein
MIDESRNVTKWQNLGLYRVFYKTIMIFLQTLLTGFRPNHYCTIQKLFHIVFGDSEIGSLTQKKVFHQTVMNGFVQNKYINHL